MQSNNKKKICIVVSSLGKGGAERSSALISKMLNSLGYDVHLVSVLNKIDYDFSGKLLNLGELKDQNDSTFGRFNRFLVFKKFLEEEKFDLIIDSRSRPTYIKEWLISRLLYKNQQVLYLVHSWKLDMYFSNSKNWAKRIYKNAKGFVGVSKEISESVKKTYGFNNISTIYNSINIEENNLRAKKVIDIKDDYILYYGRLVDKVKNISLLIDAYKASELPKQNIKLLILGSGEDLEHLKQKANNNQIVFKPFTPNPFPYIKNSRFVCLTSRFEGFPLVLLESLSVGTPVISVDCKSGPLEIVKDQINGLLIKNHNITALVNALNSFIFDDRLYKTCKENSQQSVAQFSINNITKKWQELIEQLT